MAKTPAPACPKTSSVDLGRQSPTKLKLSFLLDTEQCFSWPANFERVRLL
jgi:hypothetical protein